MTTTILTGGHVFDGEKLRKDMDVVIQDGKIKELSRGGQIKEQAGEEDYVYDINGKTVMPGMIDAHVHLTLHGFADTYDENLVEDRVRTIRSAKEMEKTLLAGVTSVRNAGSVHGIDFSVKKAVEEGILTGPKILTCGKIIAITSAGSGYFSGLYKEVDGFDEFKKAAREQLKQNADLLKVMATGAIMNPGGVPGAPQPDKYEIQAVVDEARKLNKKVAAHAHGAQGIKFAVQAGVDTIEHGTFADDEALRMMLEHEVIMVPTLAPDFFMTDMGTDEGVAEFMVEKLKEKKEARLRNVGRAIDLGVKVACGSDAGTPYNYHGKNAKELILMVEEGLMTPEEALKSGTKVSAEACGLDDRGTIEEGKVADLIVFDGNPLVEIDNLMNSENIELVMKEGDIVKNQMVDAKYTALV